MAKNAQNEEEKQSWLAIAESWLTTVQLRSTVEDNFRVTEDEKAKSPRMGRSVIALTAAHARYALANKRARRGFVGLLTHLGGLSGQHTLLLLLLAADRPNNRQSTAKLYENRLPPLLPDNRKAAPLTGKLRAAGIIKDCRGRATISLPR